MFIVVDASVWVARLVSEDVFYEPVKKWMSERLEAEDQFLAPSLLLAEVGGVIGRRTTSALGLRAIEQLQNLQGLQLIEMEHSLIQEAAQLAAELGLRGSDSIYVAVAARLDIPLVTLDADQREKSVYRITMIDISM
ncbi:MAG: type II toxin-antitoxin system VapC family toxin [Anaerolineaceae bacterium]|nr:type II toxin-antitoxin system VapC family toxin [Anaerolineaceae bacterium]